MHIGKRIQEVVRQRGCTVAWVARGLHTVRGNVYDMFERETMDTGLLCRLSLLLDYNFLKDVAEDLEGELKAKQDQFRQTKKSRKS